MTTGISNLPRFQLAIFCVLVGTWALVATADNLNAATGPGESPVKVTATAGKIDNDGQQTITITMQIDKDWHAYANPVKNEDLESCHTIVTIEGTKKLEQVSLDYPAGDRQIWENAPFQAYQGTVHIKANIKRAVGDTGPLDVTVQFVTCNDIREICLPSKTVKLQVK